MNSTSLYKYVFLCLLPTACLCATLAQRFHIGSLCNARTPDYVDRAWRPTVSITVYGVGHVKALIKNVDKLDRALHKMPRIMNPLLADNLLAESWKFLGYPELLNKTEDRVSDRRSLIEYVHKWANILVYTHEKMREIREELLLWREMDGSSVVNMTKAIMEKQEEAICSLWRMLRCYGESMELGRRNVAAPKVRKDMSTIFVKLRLLMKYIKVQMSRSIEDDLVKLLKSTLKSTVHSCERDNRRRKRPNGFWTVLSVIGII